MQDFSEHLNFTKELAFDSGKILSKHFGNISSINKKSTSIDLVTNADIESERLIIDSIQKKFPNHKNKIFRTTIFCSEGQKRVHFSVFVTRLFG